MELHLDMTIQQAIDSAKVHGEGVTKIDIRGEDNRTQAGLVIVWGRGAQGVMEAVQAVEDEWALRKAEADGAPPGLVYLGGAEDYRS